MTNREIRIPQMPIIKEVSAQTNTAQLTPEYLDAIINNPNEHEQIRRQAKEMRNNLFPQVVINEPVKRQYNKKVKPKQEIIEEDFVSEASLERLKEHSKLHEEYASRTDDEEELKSIKSEKSINKPLIKQAPALEIKQIATQDFNNFLSEFKNNLFNDEFSILSSPSTKIQLRSMTVSEYKFLTKQFEIYQKSITTLDRDNPNIDRDIDLRESILTNAIDNVLQRCITNNIKVYDLTFFDWIYTLIATRVISRGTEENLKITCSNKECKNEIRLGILDIMKKIEENKDIFIINPLDIISVDENIDIYLSIPTRGDLIEAQKIFLSDPETSLGFVNIAMYIKAFIKNNIANILTPQQKFELMNVLQYDIIKKIKNSVNKNLESFYKCFGEIKCKECGLSTEIDISDFILFFYDF